MYSPLYRIPLTDAHLAVSSLFDAVFQGDDFEHPNRTDFIEARMHGFLGLNSSLNSYDLDRQMDHTPSVLFKTFPFFVEKYQFREFDREEKICVYYPDGNTEDGYFPEMDNLFQYPMVFYSPQEFRAWMCMTFLAKLNFYPDHEVEMIKLAERNFQVEECLILMHEKLTGARPWDFGLDGIFAVKQETWSRLASSPAENIPYVKWLAMAESAWARQFRWGQHSTLRRRTTL